MEEFVFSQKNEAWPTCRVSTEQTQGGLHHSEVQRADSPQHQSDEADFEPVGQQREQEEGQVDHVTHVTQHGGHDLPLRALSHALDGGKQQERLQDLH